MWVKWGSLFESTSPLVKARYVFDGSLEPTAFLALLRDERMNWDKGYIEFKEAEKISPEVSLMYYVVKPPMFLMKARDFAEKAVRLEENGVFYQYSSSVPCEAYPEVKQYQRCETIFGGNILVKEGDSYAYYTFSQVKVGNVPSALITSCLPGTAKSFHAKVSKELEKRMANTVSG